MMARHEEKTSAGRAKMLSRGDTGDKLAEIDEVLGCLVVQTVEHHEAKQAKEMCILLLHVLPLGWESYR